VWCRIFGLNGNLTEEFFVLESKTHSTENHMTGTNHYRDQIQRATERLAQLQARELLANGRRAAKLKGEQKRSELRRRAAVADIVFATGAHTLDDEELAHLLSHHMKKRSSLLH